MKKLYSKFSFVGKIGFNDTLPEPKETMGEYFGNTQKIIDYGHIKQVITMKDGVPNRTETILNMFVEADGTREYLKIRSYASVDKKATISYKGKNDTATSRLDESMASDPKTLEGCMDFLKRKISLDGKEVIETLADSHYLKTIMENMALLKGQKFTVNGSVNYYSGKKGVGMNFTPSYIRPSYENEDEKLELRIETHFIKNSADFIPYDKFETQAMKKIPFNIFVPVQQRLEDNTYVNRIVKTKDVFGLNMDIVNSPQIYSMIESMINSTPTGDELQPMKYYTTEFVCRVKGEEVGGDLNINSLTTQEKVLHQVDPIRYSIDEIKKIRGIRPKTTKHYLIEPMFVGGVTIDDVQPIDIFGSKADVPKTVTMEQAQNMVGIPTAPVTPNMPPQTPTPPNLGMDMSQFLK